MMADGRLDVKPLITHRFSIENAEKAYEVVGDSGPSLGILLEYPSREEKPDGVLLERTVRLAPAATRADRDVRVGFIGSGSYATAVLIPAFKAAGVALGAVVSSGGGRGPCGAQFHGVRRRPRRLTPGRPAERASHRGAVGACWVLSC
jgi:hypothetical protein